MIRKVSKDSQWAKVAPLLPGKAGDPGRTAADNRLFLEGVLWITRTGAPWRDLPDAFGLWNSVFKRFRRWASKGVFYSAFKSLSGDPGFESAMIDGTIVRVHQHSLSRACRRGTGAKAGERSSGLRGGAEARLRAAEKREVRGRAIRRSGDRVATSPDHQDRCLGRRTRKPGALHPPAWPAARRRRGRALDRGHRSRRFARRPLRQAQERSTPTGCGPSSIDAAQVRSSHRNGGSRAQDSLRFRDV